MRGDWAMNSFLSRLISEELPGLTKAEPVFA
jgi:hypothetical protein